MFIFPVKELTIDKNGIVNVKKSYQEIQRNGHIVDISNKMILDNRKLIM